MLLTPDFFVVQKTYGIIAASMSSEYVSSTGFPGRVSNLYPASLKSPHLSIVAENFVI